jgi:hypothetical protein
LGLPSAPTIDRRAYFSGNPARDQAITPPLMLAASRPAFAALRVAKAERAPE